MINDDIFLERETENSLGICIKSNVNTRLTSQNTYVIGVVTRAAEAELGAEEQTIFNGAGVSNRIYCEARARAKKDPKNVCAKANLSEKIHTTQIGFCVDVLRIFLISCALV